MTDFDKMSGPELLTYCGDDASKWAEAFCHHAKGSGYDGMNEAWLAGWFANAIEHSHDVRVRAIPPPDGEVAVKVKPIKWQHFRAIGADSPEQWYGTVPETYEALTVTFDKDSPAEFQWVARPFPPGASNYATAEEAKAALETYRETRIRSALDGKGETR